MNKRIAVIVLASGVGCLQGADKQGLTVDKRASALEIQIRLYQAESPNGQLVSQRQTDFNQAVGNTIHLTPEGRHRFIKSRSFGVSSSRSFGVNKARAKKFASLVLMEEFLHLKKKFLGQADKTPVEPATCPQIDKTLLEPDTCRRAQPLPGRPLKPLKVDALPSSASMLE